jgi:hypothetical protein
MGAFSQHCPYQSPLTRVIRYTAAMIAPTKSRFANVFLDSKRPGQVKKMILTVISVVAAAGTVASSFWFKSELSPIVTVLAIFTIACFNWAEDERNMKEILHWIILGSGFEKRWAALGLTVCFIVLEAFPTYGVRKLRPQKPNCYILK